MLGRMVKRYCTGPYTGARSLKKFFFVAFFAFLEVFFQQPYLSLELIFRPVNNRKHGFPKHRKVTSLYMPPTFPLLISFSHAPHLCSDLIHDGSDLPVPEVRILPPQHDL